MVSPAAYPGPLRVAIVCPAPPGSRLGNRVTALRWQRVLAELGHEAALTDELAGPWDLVIALHAAKSAGAVEASRASHPARPVVVALTGTDLYRDLPQGGAARRSLDLADAIVVLHDLAPLDVPEAVRGKVRVIRQSADPPVRPARRSTEFFEVALVAHARPEKDPLRAPLAARLLPAASRLRIVHAGRALSAEMAAQLEAEAASNPRYRWLGELSPAETGALIARARLLVLTSAMEGGANVLGEAIACGTPPLCSRIPAAEAALGEGYPGLFPVGDTGALAALFARAEAEPAFFARLEADARARRPLFTPEVERAAFGALLEELREKP